MISHFKREIEGFFFIMRKKIKKILKRGKQKKKLFTSMGCFRQHGDDVAAGGPVSYVGSGEIE